MAPDHIRLLVYNSEFDKNDLQTQPGGLRLVFGEVLGVGINLDRALTGQKVVAWTKDTYRTIVDVPTSLSTTCQGLKTAHLLPTLSTFCNTLNATIESAKIQKTDHLLLLPAPQSIVEATANLSHRLGFKVTIVTENERKRTQYQTRPQLHQRLSSCLKSRLLSPAVKTSPSLLPTTSTRSVRRFGDLCLQWGVLF